MDFRGCVSETWARSATFTSVRRWVLSYGMIDEKLKIFPVWDSMIQMVRKKMSNEESSLSKNSKAIRECYFEQKLKDQVEEETFDSLKFPLDKDINGNAHDGLRRTQVIHFQRARALSAQTMRQINFELTRKFRALQDHKFLKMKS